MKYWILASDGLGTNEFLAAFEHRELAIKTAKYLSETTDFNFNDPLTQFSIGRKTQGQLSVVSEPDMDVEWEQEW